MCVCEKEEGFYFILWKGRRKRDGIRGNEGIKTEEDNKAVEEVLEARCIMDSWQHLNGEKDPGIMES